MIGKTYLKLFMKSESGTQMLVTYTSKQLASPSVCRRSFSGGKLATKRGEEFHYNGTKTEVWLADYFNIESPAFSCAIYTKPYRQIHF